MGYEAEFIERAALADVHAAATPRLKDRLRLQARWAHSALISIAGMLPPTAIVINRTIGLGLSSPATKSSIREIVDAYSLAQVTRYFVQINPNARPAALVGWLEAAGLEQARGWQKFSRGRESPPDLTTDLSVRQVGAEAGEAFARIVCDAFDLGNAAVPWLSGIPGRKGWHIFMSYDGDVPAGTGAVFIRDGIAWMDFAATAPAYRRRGSQGALLARRIEHALELGCSRMFTCTGEAVEGDPQHSYRNILKCGFSEDYVRANYAPPKAGS